MVIKTMGVCCASEIHIKVSTSHKHIHQNLRRSQHSPFEMLLDRGHSLEQVRDVVCFIFDRK